MSAEGQWKITTKTPMGPQEGTLNLSVDGDVLKGSMDGAQGSVDIENGKIEAGRLSWSAQIPSPPITLEFSAAVDGDSITGDVKFGAFGSGTFEGSRA